MKNLSLLSLCIVLISWAYLDALHKNEAKEAELNRQFMEEINAREDQLASELEPLIERNKKLDEKRVLHPHVSEER